MTSTPSTSNASSPDEHPEVAEISALSEGILPVERQREVRAHLAHCELCADVRASLDEIRETLGTLPGPVTMPEDVANRLDAALAAEALLNATTPADTEGESGEPAPVSRETTRPAADPSAERTNGQPDERPARAAGDADTDAASVSASGTDPDPALSPAPAPVSRETRGADRPAGHASGSTRPGGPSRTRGERRSRRWRTATLIAAASVVVLGIGGITIQSLSNSGGVKTTSDTSANSPRDETSVPGPSSSAGPKSSRESGGGEEGQLKKRVQTLLSDQSGGSPSASGSQPGTEKPTGSPTVDTKRSPSGNNTLREDTTGGAGMAPSCVRDGIHRAESPLAVDADATYEGRAGYLVVLPHQGGDPQRVDAYVVDPSCVSADPSGPGKVLLKRTYPRG